MKNRLLLNEHLYLTTQSYPATERFGMTIGANKKRYGPLCNTTGLFLFIINQLGGKSFYIYSIKISGAHQ